MSDLRLFWLFLSILKRATYITSSVQRLRHITSLEGNLGPGIDRMSVSRRSNVVSSCRQRLISLYELRLRCLDISNVRLFQILEAHLLGKAKDVSH
jgi:hypothetical protein